MFRFKFSSQLVKKCRPCSSLLILQRFGTLRFGKQGRHSSKFDRRVSPKLSAQKPEVKKLQLFARDKIRSIYSILKYSPWDSAYEQLEKFDVKWDSYTVTQVLKAHPPMQKAWLFFNWVSTKENFKHDQYTCTTMMDIFGEAKRLSSMMHVFDQMKEKKMKIDAVTYTSLMHWTSNSGDVDGAMKLWEEMRGKGLAPTIVSYTAYIKILLNHKRVKEASGVYKEMIESGISPNRYTYTVLMEYLASCGKTGEALQIFDQMQEIGEHPDKASCNSLIEICSGVGDILTITRILQYMEKNFLVLRYPVYCKALQALEGAAESVALLRQVNRHISESENIDACDQTPSEDVFGMENSLAWSILNKRNFTALDSLLADFKEKNVELEAMLISKIIEVNTSLQRQAGAMLAYEYSLKLGIDLERVAYLSLLGLSIRTNSFEKVVEIVGSMVDKGHSLSTQMSSLLIHRVGLSGDAACATKLFNLLPSQHKSSAEYTALMSAFFSSRNADLGVEVFERMKFNGVEIAEGTSRVLMDGLEKCGRIHELKGWRRESKPSSSPSMEISICNLLFSGNFSIDSG